MPVFILGSHGSHGDKTRYLYAVEAETKDEAWVKLKEQKGVRPDPYDLDWTIKLTKEVTHLVSYPIADSYCG